MPWRLLSILLALSAAGLGACTSVPSPAAASSAPAAPVVSLLASPSTPPFVRAPGATRPAAAAPAGVSSAPAEPASATDRMLESSRQSVRSTVEWLARGVDGWFGDKPFEEGGKVSDGLLTLNLRKQEHQGANFNVRFNAHFRLPNIEQHGYLFIGREDRRDVITDTPVALSNQQRLLPDRPVERTFLAGIGISLRDAIDLRLGVGAGLKPYAQASSGRRWDWDRGGAVDVRETLFVTRSDRLGSTTALSVQEPLSSSWALRWLNAATITQVSKNFDWSSSLGAYRSFGDQRLLSLEALFTGTEGTGVGVSDLGLQARWEQPIYRDWLLAEVLGGHFWPRPDALSPRGKAWAIGGSLKMRF